MKEKQTTKLCKHCQTEIPIKASVCPNCRKKQGNNLLAGIILAVILIGGCSVTLDFSDDSKKDNVQPIVSTNPEDKDDTNDFIIEQCAVEEKEIYNEHDVKITVKGLEIKDGKSILKFELNNSSNKDYSICANTYSVNGLVAGTNEYGLNTSEVAAGKSGKLNIEIKEDFYKKHNMTKISDFKILFWAYNDDFKDWDTENITIKTDKYDKECKYTPSGEKVYSDDNLALWLIGKGEHSYEFAVKNKLNGNLEYTIENASVNDWSYDVTEYSFDNFQMNCMGKTYMTFVLDIDDDFISENEIDKIEGIEFAIKGYDYDNKIDFKTEKITVK